MRREHICHNIIAPNGASYETAGACTAASSNTTGTRRLRRRATAGTRSTRSLTADEIVDGPGRPADPQARRIALEAASGVARARADGGSRGRGGPWSCADRQDLPPGRDRRSAIDAHRLRHGRIETGASSSATCSAPGSVGSILAVCLTYPRAKRQLSASPGLQSRLRDVRQEWELDRVYLPAQDWSAWGITHGNRTARAEAGFRHRACRWRRAHRRRRSTPPQREPGVCGGNPHGRSVYGAVLDRAERSELRSAAQTHGLPVAPSEAPHRA